MQGVEYLDTNHKGLSKALRGCGYLAILEIYRADHKYRALRLHALGINIANTTLNTLKQTKQQDGRT